MKCVNVSTQMEEIRELHFLNSSRFEAGKFSCVVDYFLELWLRKVSYFLGDCRENYFIRLFSALSGKYRRDYELSRDNDSDMAATQGYYNTLHVLRSDVWSYIREKCPSFVRMDCNAQFSEIFCTNVFFNLTDIQKKNILSQYIQNGFCSDCQRNLRVNNQVFLYYVSLPQVVLAGYFMSDLPN